MVVFIAIQAGVDRVWVKGLVKTHRRGNIRSSHKLQGKAVLVVSCDGRDKSNCGERGILRRAICYLCRCVLMFSSLITPCWTVRVLLSSSTGSQESFISNLHPPGGGEGRHPFWGNWQLGVPQ